MNFGQVTPMKSSPERSALASTLSRSLFRGTPSIIGRGKGNLTEADFKQFNENKSLEENTKLLFNLYHQISPANKAKVSKKKEKEVLVLKPERMADLLELDLDKAEAALERFLGRTLKNVSFSGDGRTRCMAKVFANMKKIKSEEVKKSKASVVVQ